MTEQHAAVTWIPAAVGPRRVFMGQTNGQNGSIVIHAFGIEQGKDRPIARYALVEYDRYNGSSSELGLWTRVVEVLAMDQFELLPVR